MIQVGRHGVNLITLLSVCITQRKSFILKCTTLWNKHIMWYQPLNVTHYNFMQSLWLVWPSALHEPKIWFILISSCSNTKQNECKTQIRVYFHFFAMKLFLLLIQYFWVIISTHSTQTILISICKSVQFVMMNTAKYRSLDPFVTGSCPVTCPTVVHKHIQEHYKQKIQKVLSSVPSGCHV